MVIILRLKLAQPSGQNCRKKQSEGVRFLLNSAMLSKINSYRLLFSAILPTGNLYRFVQISQIVYNRSIIKADIILNYFRLREERGGRGKTHHSKKGKTDNYIEIVERKERKGCTGLLLNSSVLSGKILPSRDGSNQMYSKF